ncbi:MAG TPA: oligosaccharide flippase family protein, partial [Rhodospirillaceae bacterium]|nr:oligosaccharide flippase family protein [Rhodospirillaceae bacterium]
MPEHSLKKKTVLAFIWCSIRSGIEQIATFIIFLFLGRMLTPDDFGVVALAAGIVEVLRLLSWVGLFEAIIRAPELDEVAADTAFWTSVTIGGVLVGLVLLLAAPAARLFDQPVLAPVIRAMSLIVIASALGITHTGRLARNFGHKSLALRALAANIAGGLAALAAILAGGGLWALVAQRVAAEVVQTAAVWIALPWLPKLRFSPAEIRRMAGFGARITIVNIIAGVHMRVQEAVVGLRLPVAAVGSLRIANRLTELIQQMVFLPANQATMVAFSRLQADPANLQRAYLQALRLAGLAAIPCFLGLACLGPRLVPWLFGNQWTASVPILQALCLAVVPTTVLYFMPPVLVAVGDAGGLAWLSAANLTLGVIATLAAARHGILAVGIGLTVRSWLLLPACLYLLNRASGLKAGAVLGAVAMPTAAAVGAALPVLGLADWQGIDLPVPVRLGLDFAAFATVFTGLLLLFGRS